tara:strand:+ start:156 stop:467 length:312 start_codon:yes stop_codon:yes gene_type:complete
MGIGEVFLRAITARQIAVPGFGVFTAPDVGADALFDGVDGHQTLGMGRGGGTFPGGALRVVVDVILAPFRVCPLLPPVRETHFATFLPLFILLILSVQHYIYI